MLNIQIDKLEKRITHQISDEIRRLIRQGTLKPGEKLPSLTTLSEQLNIHKHTVKNSFEDLIAEGWISSKERVGYHISLEIPSEFYKSRSSKYDQKPITKKHHYQINKNPLLPDFSPINKIQFNFQSGLPDLRLVPVKEIRRLYHEALKDPDNSIFDYGSPLGHEPLIDELTSYLRRTRQIQDRQVAVTNGSQEALYIISQLLLKPGDSVIMEDTSYAPARIVFKLTGASIVSIKNTNTGPDLKELEKKMKKYQPRFIFLTPLHHFPTCHSIPVPKRHQIFELCEKYNVMIIEDDYDHEVHFAPPPAPMAANDPSERVIYLSTFSKALFPSFKIGFVALPAQLVTPFINYRRILTHQNERISQDVVARFLCNGGLERHLRRARRIYQRRKEIMVKILDKAKQTGVKIDYNIPDGGLALWLNIQQDSTKFAKEVQKKGVFVLPESNYHIDQDKGTHLRLGFSNQNEEEIQAGLELMLSNL